MADGGLDPVAQKRRRNNANTLDEARLEAASLRVQRNNLLTRCDGLQARVAELEGMVEQRDGQITQLQTENGQWEADWGYERGQVEAVTVERDRAQEQLADAERRNVELTDSWEAARGEQNQLNARAKRLQLEMDGFEQRLGAWKQQQAGLERGYREGARITADAADRRVQELNRELRMRERQLMQLQELHLSTRERWHEERTAAWEQLKALQPGKDVPALRPLAAYRTVRLAEPESDSDTRSTGSRSEVQKAPSV